MRDKELSQLIRYKPFLREMKTSGHETIRESRQYGGRKQHLTRYRGRAGFSGKSLFRPRNNPLLDPRRI